MMEFHDALLSAKAHSLAIRQIPGIRLAEIRLREDGALFGDRLYSCVGYCEKCDRYFQSFRARSGLIIEVVDVGYSEPPAPSESESLTYRA